MALRKVKKVELTAQVVKGKKLPCAFCSRSVDDELNYGKLYAIGDIQCHYFCALLSCCLVQKGKDDVGLFGFLYQDIQAEVARAKKHKCSYCLQPGASMGCCVSQCRKQFHLPCGREKNAVSLFFGNYKSYCQLHAPKQKVSDNIMAKARIRKRFAEKKYRKKDVVNNEEAASDLEAVCVICYEEVSGYPTTETFWPPCCAKDAWFHRSCLQRMSLSAGMHYLKCPLCNDKDNFYEAVVSQGYYVPDRDAAWELEQNAFAEIYERPVSCSSDDCECPMGRNHDADNGPWDIKLCMLCGSVGIHAGCQQMSGRYVCATCQPAAPKDLESLAESIEAVILAEENQHSNTRRGPIMPSRMSLRRTKGRMQQQTSSASNSRCNENDAQIKESSSSTVESRRELNLKPPKRTSSPVKKVLSSPVTSPIKLLEESNIDNRILEKLKKKLRRPMPMNAKRRIVNNILGEIINVNVSKQKEPVKPWFSPKKCSNTTDEEEDITTKLAVADKVLESYKYVINRDTDSNETKDKSYKNTNHNCKELPNIEQNNNNEILKTGNSNEIPERAVILKYTNKSKRDKTPQKNFNLHNIFSPKKHIKDKSFEEIHQISKPQSVIDELNKESLCVEESKEKDKEDISKRVNNTNKISYELSELVTVDKEIANTECLEDTLSIDKETILKDGNKFPVETNLVDDDLNKIIELDISNEDLQIFTTPKNLKTINIENDSSIEISENNQIINIDVVKMENTTKEFKLPALKSPVKNKKCFFKFSATDKEVLQNTNFNLDMEIFKNHYLNEVEGDRSKIKDLVDINTDSIKNIKKRKLESNDLEDKQTENSKRKKLSLIKTSNDVQAEDVNNIKEDNDITCVSLPENNIKNESKPDIDLDEADCEKSNKTIKRNNKNKKRRLIRNADNNRVNRKIDNTKKTNVKLSLKNRNNVQVDIDSKKSKKKNKKIKTKLSIRNKKLELKIKWREERFNLRITETKRKRKLDKKKCFKQYVLKYNVGGTNVIAKPEGEISPPKRKYVKQEKPQDKLVQMSIENFFKKVP